MDEADAAVKAFQASLEVYKLNLSFTKVTSPIDGQVSRYFLTLGNLVVQDQTLLTTVVSLDPMYVYFDVDEGTCCAPARRSTRARSSAIKKGQIPVLMALQGEEGFPAQGHDRLRQQPGEPEHGQHLGPRRVRQSASRRTACACCRRGCSCGSACRSASRTRRSWSSTGPSAPIRA